MHTLKLICTVCSAILAITCVSIANETEGQLNADTAIMLLKTGNERYIKSQSTHLREDQERRTVTSAHGQHPYVSILSCSDSRVPLETIFDAGIGELFVIRVAGNVADGDEIGSLEYGVGHLQTPLLLVLGHTKCGAVTAAVNNSHVSGSIPLLINKIKPVVVTTMKNKPQLTGDSLILAVTSYNVWQSIETVFKKSEEIRELVKKGEVKVIGGIYDIETGTVSIMGSHPQQEKLIEFSEEKPKVKTVVKSEPKAEPVQNEKSSTATTTESRFHGR
jgi:carbonic anhydrase